MAAGEVYIMLLTADLLFIICSHYIFIDPFRVRRGGSTDAFVEIDLTGGASAEDIKAAIAGALGLLPMGAFYMRKNGAFIAGFHSALYGPHEVFSQAPGS